MQEQSVSKSKRIASNTLVLFARMFIIMIINLYSVRFVLKGLGVSDYGLFNAIAGVVLTSTFITSTLASAIQRFYSYSLGQNDDKKLREIFTGSVNITIVLSILILLIFEIAGPWFMHTQMTIPAIRQETADWIFQFSLIIFLMSLIQIPFTAAIFSNEDMNVYAIISLVDCFGKFLVAIVLSKVNTDHLFFYGAGLLVASTITFLAYTITALVRYPICRYVKLKGTQIYKELLSFSGWTMYGTLAGVGMIQGTTILLNIFFGPLVNAAYSIANQISNAITAFENAIVLAFRPAMVKSYSSKDFEYLDRLFGMGNKFLLYAMLCITIPAILEMRTVLTWWLGNGINDNMVLFSRLFIVYCLIVGMHNPITTIIQSTGKVRNYYLCVESLTLLCLPIMWAAFKLHAPAYYAFVIMIGLCILAHFLRLFFLRKYYPYFKISKYFTSIIIPGIIIAAISFAVGFFFYSQIENTLLRFITVIISTLISTITITYFIGLKKSERQSLKQIIEKRIKQ